MADPPETVTAAGGVLEHYRLLEQIGAGGMGVVYRGQDLRLGRMVAIKLLPGALARDPVALARFRREAQVASALNHPGICTIHDVGESGGIAYLVMEYLEGSPLDDLIARGALTPPQVVGVGRDIADALDAAHRAGILHRDVKPANIFVTARGQAKLLDFGIARVAGDRMADARTATALTAVGATPGTVAYMSPEQMRGGEVDARSDIFSLGAVLYEMATGKRALGAGPRSPLTPALDRIVGKALQEDPNLRYQTAADLRAELARLDRANTPTLSRRARAGIAAALTIAAAIGGIAYWRSRPVPRPFDHFAIAQVTNTGNAVAAAISPDGRFVADVRATGGLQALYLRNVATGSDTEIAPARSAVYAGLAFSPDGNYLYHLRSDGQTDNLLNLFRQPVLGGEPQPLVRDVDTNVTFAPKGDRIAYARANFPAFGNLSILVAAADGTGERVLITRPLARFYNSAPAWSPDGKLIAYVEPDPEDTFGRVSVVDVQSAEIRPVFSSDEIQATSLAWTSEGRDLIVQYTTRRSAAAQRQVGAIAFPSGAFRTITRDINDYADIDFAAATRSVVTVQRRIQTQIDLLDAGDLGAAGTTLVTAREAIRGFRWTDAGEIVYSLSNRILARAPDGLERTILVTDLNSPPGQLDVCRASGRIVLQWLFRTATARQQLWSVSADGSEQTPLAMRGTAFLPTCSPDGKWAIYMAPELSRIPIAGGAAESLGKLVVTSATVSYAPDGKTLAAIVLTPAPGATRKLVFLTPGAPPRLLPVTSLWSGGALHYVPDGSAVSFLVRNGAQQQLWAQPIDGSASRVLGTFTGARVTSFDWSPDGKRIAVKRESSDADVVLLTDTRGS